MTARKEPFSPAGPAVDRNDASDAPARPDELTRICQADGEQGTVLDPGFDAEPSHQPQPETTLERGSPAGHTPPEKGKKAAGQDISFAAFGRVPYEAANPLLAGAAPLLIFLGDLSVPALWGSPDHLRRHLTEALRLFGHRMAESEVDTDDTRIAQYLLCETADDVVGNLPGMDRVAWLEDGMLARFFRVGTAGTGFYEALNAVLASPEAHCDLVELIHACLALGFRGQYRSSPDGNATLDHIRHDAYEALRHFRPRPARDISPRWEGLGATMPQRGRRVPLRVIAAAVPALVAAVFLAARTVIADRAGVVVEQLAALNPPGPVVIHRTRVVSATRPAPAAMAPPSPARRDVQLDRIRNELRADVANGMLSVETKGDFVAVEIAGDALFDPATARIKATFGSLAGNLVGVLDKEAGPIFIVGYADSRKPGITSVFRSNYDLSLARAQAVKDILIRRIGDPSRLRIAGKGDEDPVADNKTAEGRALNRRIDILIRRERTP